MPQSNQTVYVIVSNETPTAVAPTLEAAQQAALAQQTKYQQPGQFEHRWEDKQQPGEVWRLMQRSTSRGGRFSWTMRSVHAVEMLTGGDES
ncbi:hypothetical protein ACIRD2_03355 [Streptomyces sp. NPDC093595]|uniref:hypothetical protein n=1 Tax=Streptomyces sp. NPDC093595 TaxID=3366045 RepID=UPI003822E9FB